MTFPALVELDLLRRWLPGETRRADEAEERCAEMAERLDFVRVSLTEQLEAAEAEIERLRGLLA